MRLRGSLARTLLTMTLARKEAIKDFWRENVRG